MAGIYMTPVNRGQIDGLNLYLNNLPSGDTASIYLWPIKALRTTRGQLGNPTIDLNGAKLVLPMTLQSGDYVELDPGGDCRVYDQRGTLLRRLAIKAEIPALKAGENRIAFSCEPPTGVAARAELTVIAHGGPLEGRTPAAEVDWRQLRDDYDAPRIITSLDGRENSWEVICRKSEQPIPFGAEIDVEQATGKGLSDLQLTIGNQRLVFPAELSTGDRLVFDGRDCRLYRKGKGEPQRFRPQGAGAALQGGRNVVVLSFGTDAPPELRVAVSLVRHYP